MLEFVTSLLADLASKLGPAGGLVADPEFRATVVQSHAAAGMPASADVHILTPGDMVG